MKRTEMSRGEEFGVCVPVFLWSQNLDIRHGTTNVQESCDDVITSVKSAIGVTVNVIYSFKWVMETSSTGQGIELDQFQRMGTYFPSLTMEQFQTAIRISWAQSVSAEERESWERRHGTFIKQQEDGPPSLFLTGEVKTIPRDLSDKYFPLTLVSDSLNSVMGIDVFHDSLRGPLIVSALEKQKLVVSTKFTADIDGELGQMVRFALPVSLDQSKVTTGVLIGVLFVSSIVSSAIADRQSAKNLQLLFRDAKTAKKRAERVKKLERRGEVVRVRASAVIGAISDPMVVFEGSMGRLVGANLEAERACGFEGGFLGENGGPIGVDEIFVGGEMEGGWNRPGMRSVVVKRKDGSVFHAEANFSTVKGLGEVWVVIFRDVTLKLKAARELEVARQEAEEANRQKGDFLVDLSKLEAGKMELESIPVSVTRILEDACGGQMAAIRCLMGRVGEEIQLKSKVFGRVDGEVTVGEVGVLAGEEMPEWLLGDPTRLLQILTNLIGNSMKFTKAGEVCVKAICLSTRKTTPLEPLPSDETGMIPTGRIHRIRFSVEDTGIGIAEKDIPKLFKAYSQANASIGRNFGGTGLGLSIVQHFVQRMGGQIQIRSVLNVGTFIWFDIDMEEVIPSLTPSPNPPSVLQGSTPFRVLLVEDNQLLQKVGLALLRKEGFMADAASDGIEAIEALEANGGEGYDVCLMDLQMPRMDGIEALREIRRRGWRLPVVALTANALASDRERCAQSGFDGFLTKPFNFKEFAMQMQRINVESRP
ncbi:hypothetical protein HDU67_000914 [Dinochytrium kinnereticum]|nr:hypothetical protein HDU67_000914 [Dinochytrium kinnereticum]